MAGSSSSNKMEQQPPDRALLQLDVSINQVNWSHVRHYMTERFSHPPTCFVQRQGMALIDHVDRSQICDHILKLRPCPSFFDAYQPCNMFHPEFILQNDILLWTPRTWPCHAYQRRRDLWKRCWNCELPHCGQTTPPRLGTLGDVRVPCLGCFRRTTFLVFGLLPWTELQWPPSALHHRLSGPPELPCDTALHHTGAPWQAWLEGFRATTTDLHHGSPVQGAPLGIQLQWARASAQTQDATPWHNTQGTSVNTTWFHATTSRFSFIPDTSRPCPPRSITTIRPRDPSSVPPTDRLRELAPQQFPFWPSDQFWPLGIYNQLSKVQLKRGNVQNKPGQAKLQNSHKLRQHSLHGWGNDTCIYCPKTKFWKTQSSQFLNFGRSLTKEKRKIRFLVYIYIDLG